jgi:class 3 adenylate cyclase
MTNAVTDANDLLVDLTKADLDPIDEFRAQHQTALLVVMFTDLKGSTELAEHRGEVYSQNVREQHDIILREIVERDDAGRCIKNIGDSLMCVFAEPTAAVERAIEIQQKLADYNRAHPEDAAMQVRIGMHLGQVVVEDKIQMDVFGRHVNRAARVESLAEGGQILLTLAIYDSARGWLRERGLTWHDHGDYLLKGIDKPIHIFEVCVPGSPVPRAPRGRRVLRRPWKPWLAAGLVAALAIVAIFFFVSSPPTGEAILHVRVLRAKQVFVDPEQLPLPLQTGDGLQLIGELSHPAYASLLWLDSEGRVHVVSSSEDKRVKQIAYPPGKEDWVTLEGKPGMEMILLVTSQRPISLSTIQEKLESEGPLGKWDEPAAVWLTPNQVRIVPKLRGPGKIVHQTIDDLQYRVDQVRQLLHQESSSFHAVVLPHQ